MAKDAKGHGSDKRGGGSDISARLAAARNDPGTPIAGQDAKAADALAQGHSKSAPVPIHPDASGRRLSFDQGSANFYALQRARLLRK